MEGWGERRLLIRPTELFGIGIGIGIWDIMMGGGVRRGEFWGGG